MSLTRCCDAPRRTSRRPALHRVLTQHSTREARLAIVIELPGTEVPRPESNRSQHSHPFGSQATVTQSRELHPKTQPRTRTTALLLCAPALLPVCPFGDVRRQATSDNHRNSSRREQTHAGAELRQPSQGTPSKNQENPAKTGYSRQKCRAESQQPVKGHQLPAQLKRMSVSS
jgi:hypothetical protein